jgi:ribonuclease III
LSRSTKNLCKRLAYQFSREELLDTALTHRSAGSLNNERLEYLGDSVLNFIIADVLYHRFKTASEGKLSRLRANLVNGETLAEIARTLQLGDFLHLGPGELKSGGFGRDSILAGAMESIIGAVYLDGGFKQSHDLVMRIYHDILEEISLDSLMKDPKTRLQEYLQAQKMPLPTYNVLSITGRDHNQIFNVDCVIHGLLNPVVGKGSSRRKAEQDAANRALELIMQEHANQ